MRLVNVNKYFNKGKSNELHVLNDISFDFPASGLVAIMGQSGSGKTTLLNALCGLDKINSGEIEVGSTTISKYRSRVWDNIRNQEFGYIFQNYNIFEEKTVFDNVALSLEFLGMKDKEEIKWRVMESLELVGMDKYRNRLAGALSGGEMQRVAIARALVKDPTIVIADEPTGNLDEKNTIMIMNILKKIAKERLVILVTHEKEIGEFYADTIINIRDGQIVDVRNGSNEELKLYADSTIYLQDLNKEEIKSNRITLASYYSDKLDVNVSLQLIVEGNEIIINAYSPDKRIKYATNDSNVSIVDGKKPQLTKEEIDKNLSDVNGVTSLDKTKLSCRYNIGLFRHIKKGFQRVFELSKFKKLFLLGFIASACLLVLSFSAYVGIRYVDENTFLCYDRNLIEVDFKDQVNVNQAYNNVTKLIDEGKVNYIYPNVNGYEYFQIPVLLYIKFDGIDGYMQGYALKATYIPYNRINNYSYVVPQKGEIVIDRFIVNQIYSVSLDNGNTIQNDQLLKSTKVVIGDKEFKIVGISEENNGCVFVNPQDEYALYFNTISEFSSDIIPNVTLQNGEVAVVCNDGDYHVGEIVTLFDKEYVVKHIKTEENVVSHLYMTKKDLQYATFCSSVGETGSILLDSNLKTKEIKKLFDSSLVNAVDKKYNNDYKEAANEKLLLARILLVFAVATIVGPLIFLFFLMRSNLISRVKEVGVYRALGLPKGSILKMHASEAIAISATGTALGWLLGVILIIKIRSVNFGDMLFSANPLLLVGCLVLCVVINLVVGCIPIILLLRKTPQEILSKYDI